MVVLQKSENQVYSDIVRSLRQNFRPEPIQPSPPQSERKVRIRTSRHYRSQLPDDHWKERYNRHMKQSVRGFYTPAHIPYASVGDVCLDMRELVVSTVGLKQSSEKCKDIVVADPKEKEKKKEEEKETSVKLKKSREPRKKHSFSNQDRGGLIEMNEKLLQYRYRTPSVRAGQPFKECVRKEKIMAMVYETWKEYCRKRQSITSVKLRNIGNKFRPTERKDAPVMGDELIPAFQTEIKSEHEEQTIDQRNIHDRCVRNFGSKVSNLYTLLCYVYHLKTRDLRTKTPLSRVFLKTLKKDVLTDLKGKPLRYTRNMTQFQPLSRGANQRSSTDVTLSRTEQDHQISPNMNTRCSFVSDSPSSLFRPVMTGTGPLESRTSLFARKRPKETSDKIETWEDLLEAGSADKPPSHLQAPCPKCGPAEAGARGGVTRTSFVNSMKMTYGGTRIRRYAILQNAQNASTASHVTEQLPLWHHVATAEKRNYTNDTLPTRRMKKSSPKTGSTLSRMVSEGLTKIQAESTERVRGIINQLNRKEKDAFEQKVLALNPSFLYQLDLQRVKQAGREVIEKYDQEHVKTAPWYGDLEKEAEDLGVAKEPEVINLLTTLYPFAVDDVTTLPYVQAKLCLVVQSLPVYELCTLTMMDALKFLLVRILNTSSGTFNEWMNQRKLLLVDKTS